MYSKFNVKIDNSFYNNVLNQHLEKGSMIYNDYAECSKKCLKQFLYDNGHIDGTAMKDSWFKMEDADIFISHSHQDLTKVKAFAGWLYDNFHLTAFIDSCVWGYSDELLKIIDNHYCKNKDGKTYNYDLRNYTTSHVHMMLSTALAEMIDRTECIMFYNTPNSIVLEEDLEIIKRQKSKATLSPWIYHELAATFLIRRHEPERRVPVYESVMHKFHYEERNKINIEHNVDKYLEEMFFIDTFALKTWQSQYEKQQEG